MTGAWMKKSQLDCVKILTPSRCLTNFFLYCSIWAAMWAAISCGRTTAMPLEKEYLGMAYDWDRQWPDESMRISRNFWKQTNYISERSLNLNKTNQLFCHMRNHAQNFFAPKPRRSWGKLIWSVAADLTLDTAGDPTWDGIPGDFSHLQIFTETTTQVTTATAGLFFQRFCLAEREGAKTVKPSQFSWWSWLFWWAGETPKLKGCWWV